MRIVMITEDKKLQRGFVNIQKANNIAMKNTLNIQAFLSKKNAVKKINQDFILRNNYTKNNLRVEKVSDNRLAARNMQSSFGATEKIDYMRLHEEGGIKKPKRGTALSIAQLASRGGSKRRVVNRNLYLKRIQKQLVRWPNRGGSKKAALIAIAYTAYKNKKFIKYKNSIYKITEFRKSRNNVYFRKQYLYTITTKHPKIKPNPWMKPSIKQPIQDGQNIYNSQIRKLLRQKEII